MITSIEVIEKGDVENDKYGEGAKYVEFHGKIKAEKDDTDVVYLMNVREKETSTKGRVEFEAIGVSKETFVEKLVAENKKVLGCVHGFQVEPEEWMDDCANISSSDEFESLLLTQL